MKNKLQLLLVMIVSILTSSFSSFAYDFEVDGIYYNILSAAYRTCEVTSGDVKYEGDIVIPSSVVYKNNTVSVIRIAKDAFRDCSSLTSIVIPNSVTDIMYNAFYDCSSLTSIEIPNSVKEIKWNTFDLCSSLTTIDIPNSVTRIGSSAFSWCRSLTSVDIPNSVTEIGSRCFEVCSSLTSIKLSEHLETIEIGLFRSCENLSSLTIPGSVKYMEIYVTPYSVNTPFDKCYALSSLKIDYDEQPLGVYEDNTDSDKDGLTNWSKLEEMTNSIKNLYLDRLFERNNYMSFSSLTDLIIGEHISTLQITGNIAPNLATITCYATTPPTDVSFKQSQYTDIILKVPYEALENYKNAQGWKNFWNIEGFDPAGVDDVTTDFSDSSNRKEVSRYNLNGQPVSEDYKGVVIVRFSDGSTKKIMQ